MLTFQELASFQQGTLAWILPEQHHLLERHCEKESRSCELRMRGNTGDRNAPPVWGKDAKWCILSHNDDVILNPEDILFAVVLLYWFAEGRRTSEERMTMRRKAGLTHETR